MLRIYFSEDQTSNLIEIAVLGLVPVVLEQRMYRKIGIDSIGDFKNIVEREMVLNHLTMLEQVEATLV
jgi:hypothetical protein